ncbi:hypothetical protein WJ41_34425 [Burkholderia ubonensis]|uniref:Uncharacterized protein n=1 Tax=Burkholderia ubonensis TaxID=101571 RepID=A0ABD4E5P8_9BURK|nr:hypothetical protein WJ41_34425 [Burkholderia ubonensis]KVN88864.1 hypothetical protein WJ68_04910 [Burkholderia ubonensis]KWO78699.1 hypothetical protein WM32_31110 [Burkholderia ubonensis]OJB19190.1 hypothetical protein BGV54_20035 [Burkholderia ubonensis]
MLMGSLGFIALLSMQERRDDALEAIGGPGWLRVIPAIVDEESVPVDREVHRNAPDAAIRTGVGTAQQADRKAQTSRHLADVREILRPVQAETEHA